MNQCSNERWAFEDYYFYTRGGPGYQEPNLQDQIERGIWEGLPGGRDLFDGWLELLGAAREFFSDPYREHDIQDLENMAAEELDRVHA